MIYIMISKDKQAAVDAVRDVIIPAGQMTKNDVWMSLIDATPADYEHMTSIPGFFIGQWWLNQNIINKLPALRQAIAGKLGQSPSKLRGFDDAAAKGKEEFLKQLARSHAINNKKMGTP